MHIVEWRIAKLATPCLIKALGQNPTYKVKIVGHSLGEGTGALLTCVLREQKELSATTCVSFAPAACMTCVINGIDLVPTSSAASVDDLRAEVTTSAWLNNLRNQIERTRILSTVYRSASALGSLLPSIASAKARVAGAGAILRPVSNGTEVVMRRAESMAQAAWTRPAVNLSSWSCIGPRHHATAARSNLKEEGSSQESSTNHIETSEPLLTSIERNSSSSTIKTIELPVSSSSVEWTSEIKCSCSNERQHDRDAGLVDGENLIRQNSNDDRMNEVELWQQLEHELYDRTEGKEADVANQIRGEEAAAIAEVGGTSLKAPFQKPRKSIGFSLPERQCILLPFILMPWNLKITLQPTQVTPQQPVMAKRQWILRLGCSLHRDLCTVNCGSHKP